MLCFSPLCRNVTCGMAEFEIIYRIRPLYGHRLCHFLSGAPEHIFKQQQYARQHSQSRSSIPSKFVHLTNECGLWSLRSDS